MRAGSEPVSKNQCRAWINALRKQQDDCALLPNPTAPLPMGFPTTVTPHDRGRGSQTLSFLVLIPAAFSVTQWFVDSSFWINRAIRIAGNCSTTLVNTLQQDMNSCRHQRTGLEASPPPSHRRCSPRPIENSDLQLEKSKTYAVRNR